MMTSPHEIRRGLPCLFHLLLVLFPTCGMAFGAGEGAGPDKRKPNILFYLTDDQSWTHTSIGGDPVVRTPGFDRVAREGVFFVNAFAPAPSCAPMRASLLTGRYPWQINEGALLFGGIPREFPLFTHALEAAGYQSAMASKGYWPGNMSDDAYHRNPLGKRYHIDLPKPHPEGSGNCDYAATFTRFLNQRDSSKPFFFWMGTSEPHRPYREGAGIASGIDPAAIRVPGFLPDHPTVRGDLADYYHGIHQQDAHLAAILDLLEAAGELERTLVVVTSDNGMPFPRAKATLYDHGTRVPLALRWGDRIPPRRTETRIVNLLDLARTFLEIAGAEIPPGMAGRSLATLLSSASPAPSPPHENFTVTAMERHSLCRKGGVGYPMRALRTPEWLLVWNAEPDRWPGGDPPPFRPIFYQDYGDVDKGPTKCFLIQNRADPQIAPHYRMAFAKRPEFELFHISSDPYQLINLAAEPEHAATLETLRKRLKNFLKATGDPRATGATAPWDTMPFYLPGNPPQRVTSASHPFLY